MKFLIYTTVWVCFVSLAYSEALSAESNGIISCEALEKIDVGELTNIFIISDKIVDISPDQIALDFHRTKLIGLTVNYSDKTFFNSISEWVSQQYPKSQVLSTKEPLMTLWRNEKNAVAINLSVAECGVQLIILRIVQHSNHKTGTDPD